MSQRHSEPLYITRGTRITYSTWHGPRWNPYHAPQLDNERMRATDTSRYHAGRTPGDHSEHCQILRLRTSISRMREEGTSERAEISVACSRPNRVFVQSALFLGTIKPSATLEFTTTREIGQQRVDGHKSDTSPGGF